MRFRNPRDLVLGLQRLKREVDSLMPKCRKCHLPKGGVVLGNHTKTEAKLCTCPRDLFNKEESR